MPDQDIHRIIDAIAHRTIGVREQITLQELLAAEPFPGIRSYVRSQVVRWLEEDLRQSRKFSVLLDTPTGSGLAVRALVHTAALEYVFTRIECMATLQEAVHFVANYLCRPRWTLRQFLFAQTDRLPAAVVVSRLEDIADYRYLPDLLLAYIKKRGLREISAVDTDTLIGNIEREMMKRGTPADLARRATPLFEFFTIGTESTAGIPASALILFLSDKGLQDEATRVEGWCSGQRRSRLQQSEFSAILSGQTPPAVTPAAAIQPGESNPFLPPSASPRPDMPEELLPLSGFITPEQHSLFLRTLFDNDPAFYAGVLEALEVTATWKEAAFHLRTFYESREIDPSLEVAAQFSEAVRRRYDAGRP